MGNNLFLIFHLDFLFSAREYGNKNMIQSLHCSPPPWRAFMGMRWQRMHVLDRCINARRHDMRTQADRRSTKEIPSAMAVFPLTAVTLSLLTSIYWSITPSVSRSDGDRVGWVTAAEKHEDGPDCTFSYTLYVRRIGCLCDRAACGLHRTVPSACRSHQRFWAHLICDATKFDISMYGSLPRDCGVYKKNITIVVIIFL